MVEVYLADELRGVDGACVVRVPWMTDADLLAQHELVEVVVGRARKVEPRIYRSLT